VWAAAITLIGPTAIAAAHTRRNDAKPGRHSFIVVSRHDQRVSLYVQRSDHRTGARAAACPPGGPFTNSSTACTPPAEQNLFGAFAWNSGSATFGSASASTCRALGWSLPPCGVYTTVPNTLIVAFVGASGSGQSMTVSCEKEDGGTCPVTFHQIKAASAGGGDSEVWYADATNVIPQKMPIYVTASASKADCGSRGRGSCDVSVQAVTFTNAIAAGATGAQATGIGASNACSSTNGAPTCSLTTTEPDSFVWASDNDPTSGAIPTWPQGQFAVGVQDQVNQQTFYSQFLGTCTANGNGSKPCSTMPLPASGLYQNPYVLAPMPSPATTNVTINDTSPTHNAFNEVVVEIL
jgi:hypothetical protein